MKRPLLTVGLTLMGVYLTIGLFSGSVLPVCLQILFAVGLVISLINKKARHKLVLPAVFAVGFVACLAFLFAESNYYKAVTLCGEYRAVEAVICEYPEFRQEYGRNYCIAEIETVDGVKTEGKIRLSFSETKDGIDRDDLVPGNRITFRGYIYKVGQNLPDITRYFKSQGVYIGAYSIRDLTVEDGKVRPLIYYTKAINTFISDTLTHDFGSDVGGFLVSLLTGEKGFIKIELYDSFKASGSAHIMAVSGFNLSIAAVFLKFLLDKLRRIPLALRNLIIALAVVVIMSVADFSGSVKRAGFMMLMYLLADTLSERSDPLNNLGFSAVVLLSLNPYAAYDSSFLLSFACTWAMLAVAAPAVTVIEDKFFKKLSDSIIKRALSTAVSSVIFSLAILFCVSSISVLLFGSVSLCTPVTNLLIVPVIPLTMGFTVLHLIFRGVPVISGITGFFAKSFASYIIDTVNVIASWKYSYVTLESDAAVYTVAVLFAVITLVVYILAKKLEKSYKKSHPAL